MVFYVGLRYRKEPLYHSFMNSLVSLLFGINSFPAIHSLLVTIMFEIFNKGELKVSFEEKLFC